MPRPVSGTPGRRPSASAGVAPVDRDEAARRVSEEARGRHPEIPWREIIGARNRIAHRYDQVDNDIVWQILAADLPVLIGHLERALAEANG